MDDLRSGNGTYTYANGDVYSGEWVGGMREGRGVYTYADSGTKVRRGIDHREIRGCVRLIRQKKIPPDRLLAPGLVISFSSGVRPFSAAYDSH